MSPRFLPTPRQTNWLITVGFLSVGYALYLRYMIMENVQAGLGCDTGHQTWLCLSRKVGLALDERGVFGWVALGAALPTLLRPNVVLFTLALVPIGHCSSYGPFWSMPTQFLAGPAAASGIALVATIASVGGFLGPALIGFLKGRTETHTAAFVLLGVAALVAGLLCLGLRGQPHREVSR